MTILDAFVARDHALVVADTAATIPDPAPRTANVTKLLALPHARAVLSGRGSLLFIVSAYSGFCLCGAETVDEMAETMPALLPAIHAAAATQAAKAQLEVKNFERQSLLLVGWSPRRQRAVGWSYVQTDAETGFVAEEVEEFYLGPWESELGPAPEPRTLPQLIDTAERQRAWIRRQHPDTAAGGELIAAHVDREGVTLRAVHRFV